MVLKKQLLIEEYKMELSTFEAFKQVSKNLEGNIVLEGELLEKFKKIILEIAKDVIDVCESSNITYHLTGGSALGAVRHQGFIPWDDDIDIDILGSDFDRFCKIFYDKHSQKYWLHTASTIDHGMTVNRIRLKDSVCRTREDIGRTECGFYVDVLRIENTYNNFFLRYLHGFLCMTMGFFLSCRNFYNSKEFMIKISDSNQKLKKVFKIKIFIGKIISFKSLTWWTIKTQKVYGMCKNNNSNYVSVPAGRKHFFGELRKREDFVESTKCKFEKYNWNIPKNYKKYLTDMYGNYMELPPVEKREQHVLLELVFPKDKY